MVISSLLQYLLSDSDSLSEYEQCIVPTFDDVKRRLLLLKRQDNRIVPDHYYRLNQEKSLEGINSLSSLIRKGLFRLANEHLELRENTIYVKQHKQNRWQELITFIPPLALQMALLHIKKPLTSFSSSEIKAYYRNVVLPNTKYTALPHPYIPQLINYRAQNNGFMDLHMHLNGTTEVDSVWSDFLNKPYQVMEDIKDKVNDPMVKEQLEQEFFMRTPLEFKNLLLTARLIREYLFAMLFEDKGSEFVYKVDSVKDLLCKITGMSNSFSASDSSALHPFAHLLSEYTEANDEVKYPMAIEGLMYVLVFKYMSENERESIASMLHFYILILGLANRLLVQQKHQVGFEQFQKLTLNNLRESSELQYKKRFFQLHGNKQCNISFIEGRFSPKKTTDENIKLIQSINKGWESMMTSIKSELNLTDDKLPELKLIAHFIKKRDNSYSVNVRHKELRYEVWQKARVLANLKEKNYDILKNLVGIDAAASEFDTPPEVFAPAFRYLRRKNFYHFTYHAGEDFYHMLGGMRAIFEAVEFNELSVGDRIGHATAIGLSPNLWLQNVGDKLLVRQGEYLDDLLFVYHLIIRKNNELLKNKTPFLINKIYELSHIIYHKSYPLKIQEEAWLLRKYCPELMFTTSQHDAEMLDYFDIDEWEQIKSHIKQSDKDQRVSLLMQYHNQECRKAYNKIIKIDTEEFFTALELEMLQLMMLSVLHKKEIVIETLPTSNVRIGQHINYDTYHLWNWIKWEKEGNCIPPIVLGTDDAGIFATNIYNEYANIYCNLTTNNKVGHNDAMEIIKKLDSNAKIYRFGC